MKQSLYLLFALLVLSSCATRKITSIPYTNATNNSADHPTLNVFVPKAPQKAKMPVLIFVHGGNWNSGNKGTYGLLGRNFAKKGVVTVIPDYTLSPDANYNDMAIEVAQAIQWTLKNIDQYGGDAAQVYLTGHSAGGHLVALAAMNPVYGIDPKNIAGIILNDAAGLDMKYYLEAHPPTKSFDYLATWGNDPAVWKKASPIYYLDAQTPPMMIYVGSKTYTSIKEGNARFVKELQQYQPKVEPVYINKSHIPMVLQYFCGSSDRFDEVLRFMAASK